MTRLATVSLALPVVLGATDPRSLHAHAWASSPSRASVPEAKTLAVFASFALVVSLIAVVSAWLMTPLTFALAVAYAGSD